MWDLRSRSFDQSTHLPKVRFRNLLTSRISSPLVSGFHTLVEKEAELINRKGTISSQRIESEQQSARTILVPLKRCWNSRLQSPFAKAGVVSLVLSLIIILLGIVTAPKEDASAIRPKLVMEGDSRGLYLLVPSDIDYFMERSPSTITVPEGTQNASKTEFYPISRTTECEVSHKPVVPGNATCFTALHFLCSEQLF